MLSSPTSESVRLRRALTDPVGIGLAIGAAVLTGLFGYPVLGVVGVAALVLAFRVGAEFVIPPPAALAAADQVQIQAEAVTASLAQVTARAQGRVPADVEGEIAAIRRAVEDIVERAKRSPIGPSELFSVLRTATDYLPGALDAYLRLPVEYATTRRLAGGKTAAAILLEQLEVLHREMLEVADAVSRNDLDRLLAHGRFLAGRFAHSELELPPAEG